VSLDHEVVGFLVPPLAELRAAHAEDRNLVLDARSHGSALLCGSGGGCGLPEIAGEAALRVVILDAEHHAHGLTDLERVGIDVREVEHHAPATLELHHAIAG